MNNRTIRRLALRYARLMEADEQGIASSDDLDRAMAGGRRMRGADQNDDEAPRPPKLRVKCPHCKNTNDYSMGDGMQLAEDEGEGPREPGKVTCHDCERELNVLPPKGFKFQDAEDSEDEEDEDEADESEQVDSRRGADRELFGDDEPVGGDVKPHIRAPQRDSRFGSDAPQYKYSKRAEARALIDFFLGRYEGRAPRVDRASSALEAFRESYKDSTRHFSSGQP